MSPKENFYKKLLHRALVALGVSGILNVFLIAYLVLEFDEAGYFFSGDFQTPNQVLEVVEMPSIEAVKDEKIVTEIPLREEEKLVTLPSVVLQEPVNKTESVRIQQKPVKEIGVAKPLVNKNLPKKGESKVRAFKQVTSKSQVAQVMHVVQAGENLWVIARRYKVDVAVIKKYNSLTSDSLQPGMTLKIPLKNSSKEVLSK